MGIRDAQLQSCQPHRQIYLSFPPKASPSSPNPSFTRTSLKATSPQIEYTISPDASPYLYNPPPPPKNLNITPSAYDPLQSFYSPLDAIPWLLPYRTTSKPSVPPNVFVSSLLPFTKCLQYCSSSFTVVKTAVLKVLLSYFSPYFSFLLSLSFETLRTLPPPIKYNIQPPIQTPILLRPSQRAEIISPQLPEFSITSSSRALARKKISTPKPGKRLGGLIYDHFAHNIVSWTQGQYFIMCSMGCQNLVKIAH